MTSTPLDRVMREQGRTSRWLAEQLGTHESHVSRWRHGRHRPEQATCARIASLLDTSLEKLGWAEEPAEQAA